MPTHQKRQIVVRPLHGYFFLFFLCFANVANGAVMFNDGWGNPTPSIPTPTPGSTEKTPILPDFCRPNDIGSDMLLCTPGGKAAVRTTIDKIYKFIDPKTGKWFDPPAGLLGYLVQITGGTLDEIIAPSYASADSFFVIANGNVFSPVLRNSSGYTNYAHGETSFYMYGLPELSAFTVNLSFLGTPTDMTWTSISDLSQIPSEILYGSAVPIPGAVWLFGTGLLGLLGFKQRKAI